MKNCTGTIVILKAAQLEMNGTISHPAIVTRDWRNGAPTNADGKMGLINVAVVQDCGHHIIPRTSVDLYESEEAGDAATAKNNYVRDGVQVIAKPYFAYVLPGERKSQTITTADVGNVSDVLGTAG